MLNLDTLLVVMAGFDLDVYIEQVAMGGGRSVTELSLSERYLEFLGLLETSSSVFGML